MAVIDTATENHTRFIRAEQALLFGKWCISPAGNGWEVKTPSRTYLVACMDQNWSCTCEDFHWYGARGVRCKHIQGVQLWQEQSGFSNPLLEQILLDPAELMTEREDLMDETERIIERLRQPLDMSRVKRRKAPGEGTIPYLEGFDVIAAANELFEFGWSFDLLSEPHIMRWDKLVTTYDHRLKKRVPVQGEGGQPTTEIAGIVYLTGRITVELTDKAYSHADVGRCTFNGDTPEALDMAIAGAATDCLKRCLRQLGEQFGLSLYDKEIARTAGLENGPKSPNGSAQKSSNGRKGEAQPSGNGGAGYSSPDPATAMQQYQDGTAADPNNTAEGEAFLAFQAAHAGEIPASRDGLREWAVSHNGKS